VEEDGRVRKYISANLRTEIRRGVEEEEQGDE